MFQRKTQKLGMLLPDRIPDQNLHRRIGTQYSGMIAQVAMIFLQLLSTNMVLAIDTFDESEGFSRRLKGRTSSVLDGKTFRSALERLTEANQLNLWLDRQVNPSAILSVGPVGPTVFLAIQKIAASQSCEVMPISNVVLVGRSSWIDQMTEEILKTPQGRMGLRIDLEWEKLSTPKEVMQKLLGTTETSASGLPHDHWPETRLLKVHKGVAQLLIEGQFAQAPSKSATPGLPTIKRTYRLETPTAGEAQKDLKGIVPDARFDKFSEGLSIRANARDHRLVTQWILSRHDSQQGVDVNKDTFSLNKLSTSAENAFQQLAKTANLRCVIQAEAQPACKRLVTLEGKDVTLRFLIEKIAQQIDVQVEWQTSAIVISKSPESSR